jgi:hypothetical protein
MSQIRGFHDATIAEGIDFKAASTIWFRVPEFDRTTLSNMMNRLHIKHSTQSISRSLLKSARFTTRIDFGRTVLAAPEECQDTTDDCFIQE